MWKDFIGSLLPNCEFAEPATENELSLVEQALNIELPSDLKNLLRETDGVTGDYASRYIWNLARINADNLKFRNSKALKEIYMSFDSLLFFGDAGNGDQFAYSIQNGLVRRNDIFVWDHEDDSRKWVAPSLEKYLAWWINGTLKI